jgi:hypothetical protein
MHKSPVFNRGENVVITNSIDDHYNGKTGVVMDDEFRNYLSDYIYVVKMDDGYDAEFTADEMTAEEDYV